MGCSSSARNVTQLMVVMNCVKSSMVGHVQSLIVTLFVEMVLELVRRGVMMGTQQIVMVATNFVIK